jgi:kumamolisin
MPKYKPHYKTHSSTSSTSAYFNVKELATIYGFPPPDTTKSSVVGVLSFGGGLYGVPQNQSTPYTIPSNAANCDVIKYWRYLGYSTLQMPKVIVYPVGGATNDLNDEDGTGENTLDVSVIGGCCPNPNLTIILFLFPMWYMFSEALSIIINGINIGRVSYKPSIVSISWGSAEIEYLPSNDNPDFTRELRRANNILKRASENGINVCVASGDNGPTDHTDQFTVYFPASSPYVIAVGGTSLICPNRVYDSHTRETVWNNGLINGAYFASGGGISAFFAKPTWQKEGTITDFRNVPDIALNSDPETGIILYLYGKLREGWGGTSMAAPMFAAYLSLINQKTFVNPLLYSAPYSSNFYDVTQGNNYDPNSIKSYSAKIGYDSCTGLGSINGNNLKNVLSPIVPRVMNSISIHVKGAVNVMVDKPSELVETNISKKAMTWNSIKPSLVTVTPNGVVIEEE